MGLWSRNLALLFRKQTGRKGYGRTEEERAVITEMVALYRGEVSGGSFFKTKGRPGTIATYLNYRSVPSPTGKKWSGESVRNIVKRAILAEAIDNGPLPGGS